MADIRRTAPPHAEPVAGPVEPEPSPARNGRRPIASRARLPGRIVLRRWTGGLFVTYLVALALIAYWPTPVDRDAHDSVVWVIDLLQRLGAPEWLRYNAIEYAANIVLFVPVGLFVVILAGGSLLAWHGLRAATRDVDSLRTVDPELAHAVAEVARIHDLAPEWLNHRAAMFTPATLTPADCVQLDVHPRLTVLGAPLDQVFVMKLYAARDRDLEDLRIL